MTVSSQGRSARLTLNWDAPGPGGPGRTLRLSRLSPRGSPEGQLLQAHTNASSFEFRDLVPGSRYQLEVTAVRPCGQNASLSLTALTGARPAGGARPGAGTWSGAGRGLRAEAWPSRMVAPGGLVRSLGTTLVQ